MLLIRQLAKSYQGPRTRVVLKGVDLELRPGEYIAIMGESGVGKSTLLNLIAGLEQPDAGQILIEGVDIVTLDDAARTRLRRTGMGFVFQAFHILPYLSVAQNIALPLLLNGRSGEAPARVSTMLEAVGLGERARSAPHELSGGELQRVAIARALVHRPRLVLADEPTGNLDADSAHQVLDLLRRQLRDSGAAGILVTHSQAAARSADRALLLTQAGLQPLSLPP